MFDKECPECGKMVDEDENQCPFCGYEFDDSLVGDEISSSSSSHDIDDLFNMDHIHFDADGNPWYLPPD